MRPTRKRLLISVIVTVCCPTGKLRTTTAVLSFMACLMRLYLRRPRGFPSTSACRQGLTDLNGPLHSAHRGLAWGVDKGLLEGAFWGLVQPFDH